MIHPSEIFGNLFVDLHLSGIWDDGKYITDSIPKKDPAVILNSYNSQKRQDGFDLKTFFETNFKPAHLNASNFKTNKDHTIDEHIRHLWNVLKREADKNIEGDSLIPLPFPYIVPGGRFNEIYYWDSYFTMLGLAEHREYETIQNMVDNFAYLIDTIGFIPNGNRTYFNTRSQPPFFPLMVELLADIKGPEIYKKYFKTMKSEYSFWMSKEKKHLVETSFGKANRYYDSSYQPRDEMYADDIHLAKPTRTNATTLFHNLRAACESGWDFSSRWLDDSNELSSILASEVIPVDLHSLIYKMEIILAKSAMLLNYQEEYTYFTNQYIERASKTNDLFWNQEMQYYTDFNRKTDRKNNAITAAGIYPLFVGLATNKQAEACAKILKESLLKTGGVVTTPIESGQQWDAPNGWAPLQWICYIGLQNYGFDDLANEIANSWCTLCEDVYNRTGKLLEKYNVIDTSLETGGGEYPVQDGFGWTNGVYIAMKANLI